MKNFIAHSDADRADLLMTVGVKSVEELLDVIPAAARVEGLKLENPLNEMEAQKKLKKLAAKNKVDYVSFLGGGVYNKFIPACVSQVATRFEFITSYTPYQPEISQGMLQAIYEYQSMICNLTGMDVANASVYDGATACAEAIAMAVNAVKRKAVLVSNCLNPDYKKVVDTYCRASGVETDYLNESDYLTDFSKIDELLKSGKYAALLVQTPNFYGSIEQLAHIKNIVEESKTLFIICSDISTLAFLKTPFEYGAHIAVGDIQTLGIPMSYGGAHGGYMACLDKYKRQLPGRIVGRTLDKDGRQAFTLTLQAREQHIKRDKASSNICSNQALMALWATVYLTVLGKEGFKQANYLASKNAHTLAQKLDSIGIKVLNRDFFNEFVIEVKNADEFLSFMKTHNILAGIKLDKKFVLVAATEMNSACDIDLYVNTASILVH